MTKARMPLTIEHALTRIAGQIGYEGMAAALSTDDRKVADRTVRDWADPDVRASITLDDALTLDVAHRTGGGDGAPLFELYALRLELARAAAFADQVALARSTIAAVQETTEATCAQLRCTLPGATPADLVVAIRETEEAISAETNTLALLRQGAGLCSASGVSPGGVLA